MKIIKKFYLLFLLIFISYSSGCLFGGGSSVTLDIPTNLYIEKDLTIGYDFLYWDNVENNKGYIVSANDKEHIVYENKFYLEILEIPNTYILKVKSKGDNSKYRSSNYSEEITYTLTLKNKFIVNFDSNGGSIVKETYYPKPNTLIKEPTNPIRTGYTFLGWYTNKNFTTKWNFETNLVKANMTLYAKWSPINVEISFDADGGSGLTNSRYVTYGETYGTLPVVTKDGHIFLGWYTPTNKKISDTTLVQLTSPTTLTAKWSNVFVFKVSFNSQGGSSCSPIQVTYKEKFGTLPKPVREGYTFVTWQTSSFQFINSDTIVEITNDITLYAVWLENNNTKISFDGNGADEEISPIYKEVGEKFGSLPIPKKAGYYFLNWVDKNNKKITENSIVSESEEIVLKAIWGRSQIVDVIFYHESYLVTKSYFYGEQLGTLPDSTRKGFKLVGWRTILDEEVDETFYIQETGPIRLYPIWIEVEEFIVTLDPQGGVCEVNTLIIDKKGFKSLPIPRKTGFKFISWVDEYLNLYDDIAINKINSDIVLYAVYIENPKNVKVIDDVVLWDKIEGATNYIIKIEVYELSGVNAIEEFNLTKDDFQFEFNFQDDYKYIIKVASQITYKSQIYVSDYSEEEVYIKLLKPTEFKYELYQNYIKFTWKGNVDAACLYRLKINDQIHTTPNISISINFQYIQDGVSEVVLERVFKADDSVKSASSDQYLIYKLKKPEAFKSRMVLEWENVEYANKYILKVDDEVCEYEIKDDICSFDLSKITSSKASITIQAIKDNTTDIVINSELFENTYTKLEPVSSLVLDKRILNWDNIGSKYLVKFDEFEFMTVSPYFDLSDYYIKYPKTSLVVNVYNISDEQNILDSNPSGISLLKLQKPVISFSKENSLISWNNIPYATSYNISINGEVFNTKNPYYSLNYKEYNQDIIINLECVGELYLYSYADEFKIKYITLTFDSLGGSGIESISDFESIKLTSPTSTKDGFTLKGWSLDKEGNTLFNFNQTITENTTLYAVWDNISQLEYTLNDDQASYSVSLGEEIIYGELIIPSYYNSLPVTVIKSRGFENSIGITSVSIPNTITKIEPYAFYRCSNLTSVTIPGSVLVIGEYAFANCILKNVVLEPSIKEIHKYAFGYNLTLQEILIPKSVEVIESFAFYNCNNLIICFASTSVNSNYPTELTENFTYYTGVSSIGSNNEYKYVVRGKSITIIYYISTKKQVVIPSSINGINVNEIGKNAFYNNKNITSVVMANTIFIIGENAFYNCTNITTITLSTSLITIKEKAFYQNTSLTTISIPQSVNLISKSAFANCHKLALVYIPKGITVIEKDAFTTNNTGVIYIEEFDFVNTWEEEFFKNYQIYYGYIGVFTNETFEYMEFVDYVVITKYINTSNSLIIPSHIDGKEVLKIESYAIPSFVSEVEFEEGLKEIGENAFSKTKVQKIILPASLEIINSYAFSNCTNLVFVRIRENVFYIGESAFTGNSYLMIYYEGKQLKDTIDDNFYDEAIIYYDVYLLEENQTYIYYVNSSNEAVIIFYKLNEVEVSIPETLDSYKVIGIGAYAFLTKISLKSVYLTSSIDIIYKNAFYGCIQLTLYCEESKPTWQEGFDNTIKNVVYSKEA